MCVNNHDPDRADVVAKKWLLRRLVRGNSHVAQPGSQWEGQVLYEIEAALVTAREYGDRARLLAVADRLARMGLLALPKVLRGVQGAPVLVDALPALQDGEDVNQADQEEQRAAEARAAAEHELDTEERVRAAGAAEQREASAERVREDGRTLYDSAERRAATARELEAKGISAEVVATRMRADVSQATPATEAVKGARRKAPKARKAKGRGAQLQAQRTGLAR